MFYTHQIEIGNHAITFEASIDCSPAEPSVGIMEPSFDITLIEVEQFGEHDRLNHVGDEDNWLALDDRIMALLDADADERSRLIDDACEQANEDWLCRNV